MVKLQLKERKIVTRSVIWVVVLIASSYGIEEGYKRFEATSRQANTELSEQRQNLQQSLSRISDQEQLQNQYAETYRRFETLGVIGDENRLNWVENIEEVVDRRRLFPVNFSLSAQSSRPSEDLVFTKESKVQVQTSVMDIEMDMLHELDFLVFLNDYNSQVDGFFVPILCSVERNTTVFEVTVQPYLTSRCEIEWITVQDPDRNADRGENQTEEEGVSS